MPVLILAVSKDFDKLFEDGRLTAIAALGEFGRIVVMTVYVALVFVVAVLRAKHGRTYRTGKVLYVVLSIQGGDV